MAVDERKHGFDRDDAAKHQEEIGVLVMFDGVCIGASPCHRVLMQRYGVDQSILYAVIKKVNHIPRRNATSIIYLILIGYE